MQNNSCHGDESSLILHSYHHHHQCWCNGDFDTCSLSTCAMKIWSITVHPISIFSSDMTLSSVKVQRYWLECVYFKQPFFIHKKIIITMAMAKVIESFFIDFSEFFLFFYMRFKYKQDLLIKKKVSIAKSFVILRNPLIHSSALDRSIFGIKHWLAPNLAVFSLSWLRHKSSEEQWRTREEIKGIMWCAMREKSH